jgi:hypothetical protein
VSPRAARRDDGSSETCDLLLEHGGSTPTSGEGHASDDCQDAVEGGLAMGRKRSQRAKREEGKAKLMRFRML